MLWQQGGLEETELTGRSRGSIFPSCIVAHQFIITKGGWLFLYKILDPYKMAISHARFNDNEGFFEIFRQRTRTSAYKHQFYFPKDVIRNKFSSQEQDIKKEKWRVYSRVLEFINYFEKDYSPLKDAKTSADRVNKLMITFLVIMDAMNEKKTLLINTYLDKEREVMKKLSFTPTIGSDNWLSKRSLAIT